MMDTFSIYLNAHQAVKNQLLEYMTTWIEAEMAANTAFCKDHLATYFPPKPLTLP